MLISADMYCRNIKKKACEFSLMKIVLQAGCFSFRMKNYKINKEARKTYHGITANGISMLSALFFLLTHLFILKWNTIGGEVAVVV